MVDILLLVGWLLRLHALTFIILLLIIIIIIIININFTLCLTSCVDFALIYIHCIVCFCFYFVGWLVSFTFVLCPFLQLIAFEINLRVYVCECLWICLNCRSVGHNDRLLDPNFVSLSLCSSHIHFHFRFDFHLHYFTFSVNNWCSLSFFLSLSLSFYKVGLCFLTCKYI